MKESDLKTRKAEANLLRLSEGDPAATYSPTQKIMQYHQR
jgi:hypothetical protein